MLDVRKIINTKIMINVAIIIITVIYGLYYMDGHLNENEIDYFNDAYLHIWNGNTSLNFLLLYLITISQICIMTSYERVNRGFDRLIILRIGYKEYYLKECMKIFCKGVLCCLTIHILLITSAIIRYGFFMGQDLSYLQYQMFTTGPYLNILFFIIFSAIGTGIFCVSIFSASYLVKNKYIYRFLPLLTLFIGIMVTGMFSGLLSKVFGYDELIKTIGAMFMPTGLLQPGMAFVIAPVVNFITAFIVYGGIAIFLYLYTIKKRKQYD